MKYLILIILVFALSLVSCKDSKNNETVESNPHKDVINQTHTVIVKERMDAGGYSYLLVNESDDSYWIAVSRTDINPNDEIQFTQYMEMKDFRSETLDKTFDSIFFVESAYKKGESKMPNPHSTELSTIPKENLNLEKAENGYTIEELYTKKDELNNKIIFVRGKVVKANLGVMNRNWFHIQDGTGKDGTHDLTVTSNDNAKPGEIILVEGKLVKDKDFGSGYVYKLMVEDSKIKVEQYL